MDDRLKYVVALFDSVKEAGRNDKNLDDEIFDLVAEHDEELNEDMIIDLIDKMFDIYEANKEMSTIEIAQQALTNLKNELGVGG